MRLTRRRFLGATALLGLPPVPRILLDAAEQAAPASDDKVLVVLELSGGNDGLNTVIPFEDSLYHDARPTLALNRGAALPLKDGGAAGSSGSGPGPRDLGFHPSLQALHALYREGAVAVVQGVGYPNPNRSHFRSMDIWHTARPDVEGIETGWLGNVVSRHRESLAALDVGDERLPLALAGSVQVPTLQNLDWVDFLATDRGREVRRRLGSLNAAPRQGEVERVRGLAQATLGQLDSILEVRKRPVPVAYPESHLADRLRWVGQFIGGGFPTRVYYLSQGGYDTHAQQRDHHERLLRQLGDAVGAFFQHLKSLGAAERVVLLIFSEFGRRVRENGSLGTDHGVAAPVLLVSGSIQGGLHGAHPSLTDLDDGDLRFHTDFRRVYATLLEEVLGVPSEPILAGRFDKLPVLARTRRL